MSDNITLDAVLLPADMQWTDEFKWSAVKQSITPSLSGAGLIQMGTLLSQRPITLEGQFSGNSGYAITTRGVVNQLKAKELAAPSETMALTFSDGRTYDVIFRYDNGVSIDAQPLKPIDPPQDDDLYLLKLSLITV